MMSAYVVIMMDDTNYAKYVKGDYYYETQWTKVEACNEEEAIAIVNKEYAHMNIKAYWAKSEKEIEDRKADRAKAVAEEKAKAEARQEKRLANEKAKAEAEGLTVEEYRAKKNYERKVKMAEKAVAEAEKALEIARKKLEELKKGV